MVDFFTKYYPDAVSQKKTFLNQIRFYSLQRFLVRCTANILVPIYYRVDNLFHKHRLSNEKVTNDKREVIVSLTSFPARIRKLHLVIESLLRQSYLPNKIILWLSEEQFPEISVLPEKLLKLRERGVEIKICAGDIRSHKKYYYTITGFPDAVFVVVDDDVLYPTDMLSSLIEFHTRYPESVCFNRGYQIIPNKEGKPLQYEKWKMLANQTHPRNDILPTGVGGVLYPPNVLSDEVLNREAFIENCMYADDLWLYVMTLMNNRQLVKTNDNKLYLPILYKNNQTLTSRNVQGRGNDQQLMKIRELYLKRDEVDIFELISYE